MALEVLGEIMSQRRKLRHREVWLPDRDNTVTGCRQSGSVLSTTKFYHTKQLPLMRSALPTKPQDSSFLQPKDLYLVTMDQMGSKTDVH